MHKFPPMRKSQHQGFTLIEIMIVLVIIAIMSGVVVLNVGSTNYSGFMAEGLKIASTLEIIADEAVYTNSVIVCDVRGWPKDMQIKTTYVNGRPLKDNEKIRFYPNGDVMPMSFQISNGIYTAWVDGNMNGIFVVNN
jgi:prepilin-type N-terminal cleavage/methylation domain-containing protein